MKNNHKQSVRLTVRDIGKYGKGVFAGRDIQKKEFIHTLDGPQVSLKQLVARVLAGKEDINDPLQVGRRTYVDLDKISRIFNHSCNPSAGVRKRSELFALRDIKKGEQITYNYSMTIAPTEWEMKCLCGSQNCRKIIHDVRSVPKAERHIYLRVGAVQRYMKPIIRSLDRGTYTMPRYEVLALERLGEHKYHVD